jgi:hypothetical protein
MYAIVRNRGQAETAGGCVGIGPPGCPDSYGAGLLPYADSLNGWLRHAAA